MLLFYKKWTHQIFIKGKSLLKLNTHFAIFTSNISKCWPDYHSFLICLFFTLLSSAEWFLLCHFLTQGVGSHELNGIPIRLIFIRLATFSTVKRLLSSEYMIFIFENPLSASAELTAIALIIFLAFCTLEGTSASVRLLEFCKTLST